MVKKQNIYDYLEASGVLESGTEEDIALARKKYWSEYKAAWRRKKRKNEKYFTVSFNKNEFELIEQAANTRQYSNTRFIKEAALTYSREKSFMLDPIMLKSIREALVLNYTALEHINENSISNTIENHVTDALTDLEKVITELQGLIQNMTK